MASLRKRGKFWYFRVYDSDGIRRERKGCTDRRETEAMAAAVEADTSRVKSGLVDRKALGLRDHEAAPLTEHLEAFRRALAAKGGTAKHANVTRNRAARVLEHAKARRISDLSLSKVLDALAALCEEEELGTETRNHYVRAVKSFSRWLWKDGRAREHHLAHLSTSSSEADRRRRRALTPDEAARLVAAAEAGPVVLGMTGPDRARLYALALGSGLRASELASLAPASFDLDAQPPTVTCAASYTKNHKEAVQPLPPALAARLRPWLAALPLDRPLFAVPDRTADMIRVDLKAARVPYETPSGVCDFHALRVTFISNVVASGASVKVCQELARHSTPSLTIGVYAKASLHDVAGAVEALPDPAAGRPDREVVAATGTHGVATLHRHDLAPVLPPSGDGSMRFGADGASKTAPDPRPGEAEGIGRNPLQMKALDGSVRGGAAPGGECRRWESNPHEGRPSKDFKSSDANDVTGDASEGSTPISLRLSPPLPPQPSEPPPELAEVMDAWPRLPEPIRAAVLALVRTSAQAAQPATSTRTRKGRKGGAF